MYPRALEAFEEIVYCDTEFHVADGDRPQPICVVWYEQRARRVSRWWLWGRAAPFPPAIFRSKHNLFVAYTATAELVVFQVLGWPLPQHVLDLNVEMRNGTNGERPDTFISLHETARILRVPYIDVEHKNRMRDIAIAGGPPVEAHKHEMLRYCEDDTRVMVPILQRLAPSLSLPHALIRGEYVKASATIEYRGLPVNTAVYRHIQAWQQPLRELVAEQANRELGPLFDGATFRRHHFAAFIQRLGAARTWPRTATGQYKSDVDETLKTMGQIHPPVETLRQTIKTLHELKNVAFAIGDDGRNRYLGGLFGTITGRNSPKARSALLHRSRWWRNLIQPEPGRALAYLDFSSEEFMVQAVLAGDRQGIEDYLSGDVYLTWGRTLGVIPPQGTKETHPRERTLLKAVVLGLNYGLGVRGLARNLQIDPAVAGRWMQSFRERYARMVTYGEEMVLRGASSGQLRTRLDWRLHVRDIIASKEVLDGQRKPANQLTPNSLRNWPVQSNAAEILRLAVIEATAKGVAVVGTLHDALFIESTAEDIEAHVRLAQQAMQDASATILSCSSTGVAYPLRVDHTMIRAPEHYREKESQEWWQRLRDMLRQLSGCDIEDLGKPAPEAQIVPEGRVIATGSSHGHGVESWPLGHPGGVNYIKEKET
jgi:DNA polymerase-1